MNCIQPPVIGSVDTARGRGEVEHGCALCCTFLKNTFEAPSPATSRLDKGRILFRTDTLSTRMRNALVEPTVLHSRPFEDTNDPY